MSAAVAAPRAARLLAEALDAQGAIRIACGACGETVGHYRAGRVTGPSTERPKVRLKCTRRGCRHETLATLEEVIGAPAP